MMTQQTPPTNQIELRNQLCHQLTALLNGETNPNVLNAAANAGNVILKTVAVEIHYAHMRRQKPNIPFIKLEPETVASEAKLHRRNNIPATA